MNERAFVILVGGLMHGTRTLVPLALERMTLASRRGEPIEYVRRLTRTGLVDGRSTAVALFAPESVTEMEFDVLAADAIRDRDARH